jgi:hypothetical protein
MRYETRPLGPRANGLTLFALLAGTVLASPSFADGPANLAHGKTATASTVDKAGNEAAMAVDGDIKTRWASVQGIDPQWISVDLGAPYNVTAVKLTWEKAFAKAYNVQLSSDALTWTNVYSTTTGDGGVDDLSGLVGSGRYVRIYGTVRGTKKLGYSLWELEVYGTPADSTLPAPAAPATPPATTDKPASPAAATVKVAINCGSEEASGAFIADKYYDGGMPASNNTGAVDVSGVANPAPQGVYQSERYGDFGYTIPDLTAGEFYKVRLHFTEDYVTAAGDRVFNVSINDKDVLTNFDIYAEAGSQNKAVIKEFQVTADKQGKIAINFVSITQSAKIDGIEVLQ